MYESNHLHMSFLCVFQHNKTTPIPVHLDKSPLYYDNSMEDMTVHFSNIYDDERGGFVSSSRKCFFLVPDL